MTEPIYDRLPDPQIDAIVELLEVALRAKWGPDIVARVLKWDAPLELANAQDFPLLCVFRRDERQTDAMIEENYELINVGLSYYLPLTPLDRIESRVAALRAVWTYCVSRLRLGYDNALRGGAMGLEEVGFASPYPANGQVTYRLAAAVDAVVPMFTGTVTMRSDDWFEFDDEGVPLAGIDTTANVDGTNVPRPDFAQAVNFP